MEKLYEEYGKLMVNLELLNNRIAQVKQAIQQEMNKPVVKKEVKEKPKDK